MVSVAMLSLQELLQAARAHPLYRDWPLEAVRQVGDPAWERLPTLGREALRNLPLPRASAGELIYLSTGTVGHPKLVPLGRADLDRVATLCVRFGALEGIGSHSRVMVLLPMALWPVGRITIEGHRRLGATVYPVDLHGGIDAWQRLVWELRPTVISSTPSVLAAWAPYYEGPPLELVETTGEPLMTRERHLIEGRFGARVHDAYGLTECTVGVECAVRDGFHYWPDATHVEILAPDCDRPVSPGEEGEIVLTGFQNALLPILRYRSGDRGRLIPGSCACGHPTPRLQLLGRLRPAFDLPRGVLLEPETVADALGSERGVRLRYKNGAESPAAAFVRRNRSPMLEVVYDGSMPPARARRKLLQAIPELAELVHEGAVGLEMSGAATGGGRNGEEESVQ